jgi:hypothetical protein
MSGCVIGPPTMMLQQPLLRLCQKTMERQEVRSCLLRTKPLPASSSERTALLSQGKFVLAAAIARSFFSKGHCPGGVLFADLKGASTKPAMLNRLAKALNSKEVGPRTTDTKGLITRHVSNSCSRNSSTRRALSLSQLVRTRICIGVTSLQRLGFYSDKVEEIAAEDCRIVRIFCS